jgi:peroxiredoxin
MITAGDKLLAQKTEDKIAEEAVQMKLRALTTLAANNVGNSAKEAVAAVTKLKADSREVVAKTAERFWLPIQSVNALSMTVEERKALIDEIASTVSKTKFSPESIDAAKLLVSILSESSHVDEAALVYEQLSKVSAESSDPKYRPNAEIFAALARKIRLPGNFMEVEGKTIDGTDFDWASYRGKVVLVDYWATWCGPCVQDLGDVKKVYKKYHDKGFDVVGISLDHARHALNKFIESEQIPWAQLYDEDRQRGKGWNSPMARKYGISAIPATMLVDKAGKVVAMDVRGEDLEKQVEKLLGSAE